MGLNAEQQKVVDSNSDRLLCLAGAGAGKALKNGTKVKTPTGDVAIEQLKLGDVVFASDGNAYPVTGIYPQGKKSVIRITFSDRNCIDCNEDHLWLYQTKSMRDRHRGFDVKTTKELTQIPLRKKSGDGFANNLYIPMCNPCNYPHQKVPIDSYFLGLLIGDGGLSQNHVVFHNEEPDLLAYVDNMAKMYDCHLVKYAPLAYYISKNSRDPHISNVLLNLIRELNLNCLSINKHIPDIYKYNDVETRLSVLQGIIDTDGHVSKSAYEISTASAALARDIVEISESLGLTCILTDRDSHYVKNGQRIDLDHKNYRIFIKPSKMFPTLHRSIKHDHQRLSGGNQNYARRYITSIEYLGIDAEMTCISVDSPDHSFLTEHYIVTHNTKILIERISRLVNDGISPSNILALTFTNVAATEMRNRFEKKNPGIVSPEFKTFHAFCYSLMCKDPAIRCALGYTSIPNIASEAQEKSIDERAKTQCKITISKEKLQSRTGLSKQEQYQVTLYDKAVTRLFLMENLITFDVLNSKMSELFASDHPATKKYKEQYKYICADECLPSYMRVLTENGWYRLDYLHDRFVSGKSVPRVKSYNVQTSEYEYKPIIGALKSENRDVFEVHTEGLNKICCTSNHKIYTQRGYVAVQDLVIGQDMVILDNPNKQKTKYLLNEDQYQICLGSYLGDGCLVKMSDFSTYRLTFTQGVKQKDYFLSKISAFNLRHRTIMSGYTQKDSILQSTYTPVFALSTDAFNCVLSDISPLGLAIWYQDDGSLSGGVNLRICTGSFSMEQTEQLATMLQSRFEINAIPYKDNRGYSNLRFNYKDRDKFLALISPYMHPSMQYKTNIDISNNIVDYNSSYLNIGANFIDKITYVGTDTVYDLTVADNHNFVVSKAKYKSESRTGTIVHNCQDTDYYQMKFLNSFTNSNFFFVGDTLQNLYSWRGTSNEYIKALANSYGWEVIKLFTNYRSTNQICEYANKFSAGYADDSYRVEMKGTRDGDKVHTRLVDGPVGYSAINPKSLDSVMQEYPKLSGTTAILCRTNKEVSAIVSYMKQHNVEFTTNHESKIQHLINCALSKSYMLNYLTLYLSSDKYGEYIRLSAQAESTDLDWFLKLYGNVPTIKEDVSLINKLVEIATTFGNTASRLTAVNKVFNLKLQPDDKTDYFGKEFLGYLLSITSNTSESELYIGTIHSVKGLEYDNVFVMNVGSYSFKLNSEEMKNLFYVAITRAKNRLYIYELFD